MQPGACTSDADMNGLLLVLMQPGDQGDQGEEIKVIKVIKVRRSR